MAAQYWKILLSAFGDPGHAFPTVALAKQLSQRGHDVTVQTWQRWQAEIEAEGLSFIAAPEYPVFPTQERPLSPYQAVVKAAIETVPLVEQLQPDLVIADILTLAPALAAEISNVKTATLIPHLYPETTSTEPPFSSGAKAPRSPVGRALWKLSYPLLLRGLKQGRAELNAVRKQLDLPPTKRLHGGLSDWLCITATLPQLQAKPLPPHVKVVGPLQWQPSASPTSVSSSTRPRVLIAPSTSQDPKHELIRSSLTALADLPVEVVASWNGPPPTDSFPVPANATVKEWVSYGELMPHSDVVVTHGGHGTLMRAVSHGVPTVICPLSGDMFENAVRFQQQRLGVAVAPVLQTAKTIRSAVISLLKQPKAVNTNLMQAQQTSRSLEISNYAAETVELQLSRS